MTEYNFRRGAEEIEKARESRKGNKSLGTFAPSIFWNEDKQEKYLLFLTPIEDVPRIDTIGFIPIPFKRGDEEDEYYETVIARTDPALGDLRQNKDPLAENFDARVADTNLFVAFELEPQMEEKRGRERPVGFKLKTVEYERRIRDDEGELTDETEEVVGPAYGFILQAASNFGAAASTHDATEFPLQDWAVKVMRIGKDRNTQYAFKGYEDIPVDLTELPDTLGGVNYLTPEEREEFEQSVDLDDSQAVAEALGQVLLEKRLNELADQDRYDRIYEIVEEQGKSLDKWGNKGKDKKDKPASFLGRATRPSQRKASAKKQEDPAQLAALAALKERAGVA